MCAWRICVFHKKNLSGGHVLQWRIQDFPEEGALTPEGGAPTYYLGNFS